LLLCGRTAVYVVAFLVLRVLGWAVEVFVVGFEVCV
jgi:hypothetical protein